MFTPDANEGVHRLIPLDRRAEWDRALADVPHTIAHTHAFQQAVALSAEHAAQLYVFERGTTRIVCPVMERSFEDDVDLATPFGFSGFVGTAECPDFPAVWGSYAQEREYVAGYIGLHPFLHRMTYASESDVFEAQALYVLDLTLSEQELFRRLSRNRQRELRSWSKGRPRLITDRDVLTELFVEHYADFMRRKQARGVYALSADSLARLCDLNSTIFVGAASDGEVDAATLVGYTAYGADSLLQVSLGQGHRHSAVLIWHAVMALKEMDVPFLNLGGGITPGDGVEAFKQRFGAMRLPLRALKQIYRPQRYDELCRRVGVDAAGRSGYFPAYRAPAARELPVG
jgi:hypothetical protein